MARGTHPTRDTTTWATQFPIGCHPAARPSLKSPTNCIEREPPQHSIVRDVTRHASTHRRIQSEFGISIPASTIPTHVHHHHKHVRAKPPISMQGQGRNAPAQCRSVTFTPRKFRQAKANFTPFRERTWRSLVPPSGTQSAAADRRRCHDIRTGAAHARGSGRSGDGEDCCRLQLAAAALGKPRS